MNNNIIIKKTFNAISRDTERKYNPTASRIFTINLVLKCLGYLSSVARFILGIATNTFATGLVLCLAYALSVFILTTFFDGFAEIIQLLEDIKNKKYTEEK